MMTDEEKIAAWDLLTGPAIMPAITPFKLMSNGEVGRWREHGEWCADAYVLRCCEFVVGAILRIQKRHGISVDEPLPPYPEKAAA